MFKILRGMVFNLHEPSSTQTIPTACMTKVRPYVVLSNNGCNDTSMYIHVAPLTTRPNTKNKYYRVEFTVANGESRWINISDIMLIRSELCTAENFNANLTCDIQNDDTLNNRLAYAIQRQFSIVTNETIHPTADTVAVATPTNTQFNLPISITVSIPGYESVSVGLTPKTETATQPIPETSVITPTETEAAKNTYSKFFKTYNSRYIEIIKKRCQTFGGDLTQAQVAKILGVSAWTISKYVQYIKTLVNGSVTESTQKESKMLSNMRFIREHYVKFGGDMTVEQLCEALGLKKATVYTYISDSNSRHLYSPETSEESSDNSTNDIIVTESANNTSNSVKNKRVSRKDEIIDTVSKRFRKFGGDLTIVQLAKLLSVSTGTIDRYIRLCKQFNLSVEDTCDRPKRTKYADMTKAIREQFITDYETLPPEVVFEKYKMYGIQSIEHMKKVYKAKKKFRSYTVCSK